MTDAKKRITIAEVARRAGVSRAAVSYALRDDPNIAAVTRAKIRKVADALGYRPDPTLSKLMAHLHSGRGRRYAGKLAFLNVHARDGYWRETEALMDFRKSAAARAAELGYDTEEFWLHEPGRTPKRLAQMLVARGIRGLLVGSTGRHGSVVEFPWAKFAAVTVGYSVETPALHRVVTHHYRNTRLALAHAAAAGYSKIGFTAPKGSEATMEDLHLAAFLAYQQDVAVKERVPPLLMAGNDAGALRRWFDKHKPEVVLTTTVEVAELGVPWVKLLLWDEGHEIAGVRPGYERLGAAAVNQLAEQLQHDELGVPADPKVVLVEGRWHDGASFPAPVRGGGAGKKDERDLR